MKNYDKSLEVNYNRNWSYILDHDYRILINGGSKSGKTNVLLNLRKHQLANIVKIHLHVKDPFKSKFQLFINVREKVGTKTLKNPKESIDYSQKVHVVCENLKDSNPTKERQVSIFIDDIKAGMKANKNIRSYSHRILLQKQKTQNFTCFGFTVLFQKA